MCAKSSRRLQFGVWHRLMSIGFQGLLLRKRAVFAGSVLGCVWFIILLEALYSETHADIGAMRGQLLCKSTVEAGKCC